MGRPRKITQPTEATIENTEIVENQGLFSDTEDFDTITEQDNNLTEKTTNFSEINQTIEDLRENVNLLPATEIEKDKKNVIELIKQIDEVEGMKYCGDEIKLAAEPEEILPCHKFRRNSCGLIEGLEYSYLPDNKVDWRKMIKPEYFVINKTYKDTVEQKYQNKIEDIDIEDVDNKYLLILLQGFKDVAQLRGYVKMDYGSFGNAQRDFVSLKCKITWAANYETDFQNVTSAGCGDASFDNTSGFGNNFLTTIAENRAFVRCVRNFLNIPILGQDEMGGNSFTSESSSTPTFKPTDPHGVLQKKLDEKGKTFELLQKQCVSRGTEGAEEWQTLGDIPVSKVWEILSLIKNAEKKN